ncbi:MAG: hypothetical protein R3331_02515 [Sulfurospirillaceae bacterium]|nr:hypothetical protein [Sulfurospirillaceae bacterium]
METDTTYQSYLTAMQNCKILQNTQTTEASNAQKFDTVLSQQSAASTETKTPTITSHDESHSNDVAKFLKELHTKGAVQFFADLNQEKIDKQVEAYKQKLIGQMGDSPEAMQKINKLVEDYRKHLLEILKEKMQAEQKDKNQRNATPFEILLQT